MTTAFTLSAQSPTGFAAARFLSQASWGPTAAAVAEVQAIGFDRWIDKQMDPSQTPLSTIPPYGVDAKGNTTLRPVQDAFFVNAVTGQDQLRQRVAFALSEIWVVSGVKLRPEAIQPYLQLLQADAFAGYDQIMYDITVSPAMGHYLDMVNNNKPTATHGADENYAREMLQLFTIGLVQLDQYGRPVLDPTTKQPIPTFTQDVIEGFARTFTGWTYAPSRNGASKFPNPANWTAPMVPFDANHDSSPKLLLNGVTLASKAGPGEALSDLQFALNNIFTHPNVAPFISRQLIQHLVTSSPSDQYVKDVADVFTATHGDMRAVVKAILLDPEARAGDDGTSQAATGHLREPVLFINALMRELNANIAASNGLTDYANAMGQYLYYPASVFSYFLPGYQIPVADASPPTTANAPEFQLLSESTAQVRVNFMNTVAFGRINGVTPTLTSYIGSLGGKPTMTSITAMISALNNDLLGGAMSADMQNSILPAVQVAGSPTAMVETALYLIGSSWTYQVER
ncbi:MAG: DUF1800 domain-containing protein [Acidobacteriaceae bacterium]|nr:DUF1800 domain-containing protein [Acidobacteriaceae bacterium]